MASVQISKEEMLKRVARFKELKPIDYKAMGMGYVPEGVQGFSIIGQVAKGIEPSIAGDHGFITACVKANPGKGSPLHSHKTVEVFVPLSGKWVFFWGEGGKDETTLEPGDTVSFPPGVMHGFRNLASEDACLLAMLGGSGPAIEVEYES